MTEAINPGWKMTIAEWAASKPPISEVFLFGSRVKGVHRPDSDLNVAIRIEAGAESPLTTWIYEGRGWCEELDALLNVSVHLQMMDESDTVVLPAVREHGTRIFPRS